MALMEWTALLGNIGEFLGAIAVIATLFYLARQVKHSAEATEANTRSLRSAARFESGRWWSEENMRMALDADMARIVDTCFSDASRLNDDERLRMCAWWGQHFHMKDTLYHQYLEGVLPEDVWRAHEAVTIGNLRLPAFQRFWDGGHIGVSDAFGRYMEELRASHQSASWRFADKARVFDERV